MPFCTNKAEKVTQPLKMNGGNNMNTTWMKQSTCANSPADVFFPTDGMGVIVAKAICANCPVTEPCLEYALRNRVEHGVWGGCSERQRRRILKERRQAKQPLSATAA
jgi:WhiB family redox-sensing transcriptional regulator